VRLIIKILLVVLALFVFFKRRLIGQVLQAKFGINPFNQFMEPIGIRRNNPLNIRHNSANHWKGEVVNGNTKEGEFCIFERMEDGIRAALVTLHSYVAKHGLETIEDIVKRWAPSTDGNDPVSYVSTVKRQINNDLFSVSADYLVLANLAWAMSCVEVGEKYAPSRDLFEEVAFDV
jgi:hypothetical protein